jgi:hypothetical protein
MSGGSERDGQDRMRRIVESELGAKSLHLNAVSCSAISHNFPLSAQFSVYRISLHNSSFIAICKFLHNLPFSKTFRIISRTYLNINQCTHHCYKPFVNYFHSYTQSEILTLGESILLLLLYSNARNQIYDTRRCVFDEKIEKTDFENLI